MKTIWYSGLFALTLLVPIHAFATGADRGKGGAKAGAAAGAKAGAKAGNNAGGGKAAAGGSNAETPPAKPNLPPAASPRPPRDLAAPRPNAADRPARPDRGAKADEAPAVGKNKPDAPRPDAKPNAGANRDRDPASPRLDAADQAANRAADRARMRAENRLDRKENQLEKKKDQQDRKTPGAKAEMNHEDTQELREQRTAAVERQRENRNQISEPLQPNKEKNAEPINVDELKIEHHLANRRPQWADIDRQNLTTVENRLRSQVSHLQRQLNRERSDDQRLQANQIRNQWNNYPYQQLFAGNWWRNHPNSVSQWHYARQYNAYPVNYWWQRPAWNVCAGWFSWQLPQVWTQPIYYDYGRNGNVVYRDQQVYINNELVGTSAEYAQTAAVLASVELPTATDTDVQWLPLGTFAISTGEQAGDPSRVLQLAVDKQGIISGTLYDRVSDTTTVIQGRVDPETQRVAFRFGDNDQTVAETGLYNLTQDESTLLVHIGKERTEEYLLVRLHYDH